MEMNKELLAKAKNAKTVEELAEIAKENNVELPMESAKAYFELLHPQTGEISDEELDNVSGGGCRRKDGYLIVTVGNSCGFWGCKKCGSFSRNSFCERCGKLASCNNCKYCSYEKGLWICRNSANVK